MARLTNAPLIEVVFEIKWGKATTSGGSVQWEFSDADARLYFGEFLLGASEAGFTSRELLHPMTSVAPHVALDRYRRDSGAWPCYQTGVGVVTVNQINSGYEWVSFASEVETALEILNNCESLGGLDKLIPVGVELRYQDGFVLEEPENPIKFLRDKLNLGLKVPDKFLESKHIAGNASNSSLGFQYATHDPEGDISVQARQVLINGRAGYVLELTLAAYEEKAPDFSVKALMSWLEKAHKIQQHTFKSLVTDSLAQSFEEKK